MGCLLAYPEPERSFRYELTQNPSVLSWVVEVEQAERNRVIVAMIVTWFIVDEVHLGRLQSTGL